MKFIQYNEELRVTFIHNIPFDEINGLGKSEEELLEIGALVEDIPQVEVPNDKNIIYKYNKTDNTVTYELVDRELTLEEKNEKDILEIKEINKSQDELIDISLLATDEIYTMIEPLLSINTMSEKVINGLANLYVAMVMRGLKNIDEVPDTFKNYVLEKLKNNY